MSKGSKRRPQQVSDEEMERRWKLAFGKKKRTWREVQEEAWRELWKQRPDLKGE